MTKTLVKRRGRPSGIKDKNNVAKPKRQYTWRTMPAETIAPPKGRKSRIASSFNPFDPAPLQEEAPVVKTSKMGRPKGSKSGYPILKKRALNSKSEVFQTSKFQDGNPGGPGRPKGSRNKMTLALAKIGENNVEDVFQRLVDIALGKIIGDAKACKAVIDTAITLRKITPINFELPAPIETTEDLNKFSKKIINMAAEGEMSAEEAMEYGKLCEQELKMMTDTDVVKKIENTCLLVDLIKKGG